MNDDSFMRIALNEAKFAASAGEVPVGAVLVRGGHVVAQAHNTRESDKTPLAHAEIKVLQMACAETGDWRLSDATLYVTMEPCPMCLGALFQARVGKLVYGCPDVKRLGAFVGQTNDAANALFPSLSGLDQKFPYSAVSNNHHLEIVGDVLKTECSQLLKDFFKNRRS